MKIDVIIAELSGQYEYLSQDAENLNELELELFAAHADFLSDHIIILQKLNQNSKSYSSEKAQSIVAESLTSESLIPKPADPPIMKEEVERTIPVWKFEIKDESNQSFDYEEKAPKDLFDRPLSHQELEVLEEKTQLKVQPEADLEMIAEESSESEIFEDDSAELESEPKVEQQTLTVNQILAAQASQNTVSSQFNQRQVKDLKSLINLNDKLLFVRDLFNGYSLAYSEAIEILNRFDSFESADNFLKQNYSSKNNWAEKQSVADKFYEILNKRFSR